MTSIFAVAIASGALGAIVAVGQSDPKMREEISPELTAGGREILKKCEICVKHINDHHLVIDKDLMECNSVQACQKISQLKGKKLKKILKKFIESPHLKPEALDRLIDLCGKNSKSEFCKTLKQQTKKKKKKKKSKSPEKLSVSQIRTIAENVSSAFQNLDVKEPKDDWKSASDFDWQSEEEVESNVSMYPLV